MRAVLTVLSKELREALRDSSVLLYALGFPLLFYPLLLWGAVQLLVLQAGVVERQPVRLDVDGSPALLEALLAPPVQAGEGGRAALLDGALDAVVRGDDAEGFERVEVLWRSTRARSERAHDLVEERVEVLRTERLEALAVEAGLPPDALCPSAIRSEDAAGREGVARQALARVLPLLALTTLLLSIAYPTVEVLVAERERGTLETTLLAAVPRRAVVAGKFLAVSLTGLLAVAGNGVAVWATLSGLVAQADGAALDLGIAWSLPLALALLCLLALAPAAAAWTGLALLPARSFRAGQNRATLLLSCGLGLAAPCLASAAEPGWAWAAVPVAGTAMALRGALGGALTCGPIACTLLANLLLAALGILLAGRVLRREDYLFGQALPRWLRWLEGRNP